MKRRNGLFSVLGISFLVAVLLAGCSNLADPPKKAVISFDESSIRCALASDTQAVVRSNTPIAENTALLFTATPSEGKMVSTWKVNGQPKATTETFLYYANPKELKIKEGQTITVTFDEVDAKLVTFTFKENVYAYKGVKDENGRWSQGSTIASGVEVKAGEYVFFKAKTADKMIVDTWFANGKAVSTNGMLTYPVVLEKAKDSEGKKVIDISFTEKAGKVSISFDEKTTTAKYRTNPYSSWFAFAADAEFDVDTELEFTALPAADKVVSVWKLNDVVQNRTEKKPAELKTWKYTIDSSDVKAEGDKKVIKVSFEQRDANKVKVSFGDKISCYSSKGFVTSGTDVENGTSLTFRADLEKNQTVKGWYADTRQMSGTTYGTYTVNIDADEALDGAVVISYKLNDAVTVTVDTASVLYTDPADKVWYPGNQVTLTAKVPYGEVFEGWYKDGKKLKKASTSAVMDGDYFEYSSNPSKIAYKITAADARKGTIKFTSKVYPEVTLTYDGTGEVYSDPSKTTKLNSGTKFKEGTVVYLLPKIPANQKLKALKLNGHYADTSLVIPYGYDLYAFTVQNMYANSGTINLSCEFEAQIDKKIKVQYDANKIKCIETYSSAAVPNGKELETNPNGRTQEGLTFTVIGADAGKSIRWFVNGVQKSDDDPWSTYLWLSDVDGGNSPATITYSLR